MFGTIRNVTMALAVCLCGGLALAHTGATGIVKERMDAMKDIAAQMKQIGAMIKGERAYSAELAASAAAVIAEHAAQIPADFPVGSTDHPSEALPTIWSDWDGFTQSADDLAIAATSLSEIAAGATSVDDIRAQFAIVGKTCSACHEEFRQAQ